MSKADRGFGALDADKQREIARKGGIAAHKYGRAHKFNHEEAKAAGRKGGKKIGQNKEHMSEIGRKGGKAKKRKAGDR